MSKSSTWRKFQMCLKDFPCSRECDRRSARCKTSCDEWKEYEKRKAVEMKKREETYRINDALYDFTMKRNHSFSTQGGAKFKHGNHKGR